MAFTRRELLASAVALTSVGIAGQKLPVRAEAAGLPMPRMPLDEFANSPELVAALRKGVNAMKQRKPSDPLSWFYQAAIHGVTDEKIAQAVKDDPNVGNVNIKKYWNQCPHMGQNSANFLPWHRAHTFYFERILRMHAEREDFSLPYWNYCDPTNDRKFPKIYGIQYLDGDLNNNDPANINPLWDEERDFYFTTYQHPLTDKLPVLALTDQAIDATAAIESPVFFGETEQTGFGGGIADDDPSTRGLLESSPHDQIHRAIGGIVGSHSGDMATPPTAAFDPVFSVHHANVDWLWVQWSCMSGKSWGKLPSATWLDESPWFFFDENGSEINEARRRYFDHRALGIRFKYEDLDRTPLLLPELVASLPPPKLTASRTDGFMAAPQTSAAPLAGSDLLVTVGPASRTAIALGTAFGSASVAQLGARFAQRRAASPSAQRFTLRLGDIEASTVTSVGFDVHLTSTPDVNLVRTAPSFMGSINLFNHRHDPSMPLSQDLDASRALADAGGDLTGLSLVFVPYPLLKVIETGAPYLRSQPLTVRGIEFRSTN
jgi:Common central domain of tyrosinase